MFLQNTFIFYIFIYILLYRSVGCSLFSQNHMNRAVLYISPTHSGAITTCLLHKMSEGPHLLNQNFNRVCVCQDQRAVSAVSSRYHGPGDPERHASPGASAESHGHQQAAVTGPSHADDVTASSPQSDRSVVDDVMFTCRVSWTC